jgi:hypothetical protein
VIHKPGEPWYNDIARKTDSSTGALWKSYQQSHFVAKQEELRKENDEFGLKNYLCSYLEVIFKMP